MTIKQAPSLRGFLRHREMRAALRPRAAILSVLLAIVWGAPSSLLAQQPPSRALPAVFPGQNWTPVDSPHTGGFDGARLKDLSDYMKTLTTTGLLVIVGGRVLFHWGDVQRVDSVYSVSKSILAMMYGKYVANGTIHLDWTLRDLHMNDVGGLLPIEQSTTIRDLLTGRSGVFHEPSNAGGDLGYAPPRGSRQPGTYFLYNNWDFNAAGAAFEQVTHKGIYDALNLDLARPIQMQDFSLASQHYWIGAESFFRWFPMSLSTRDLARVGYLMLRDGNWNGRQLIPANWVRTITSVVTPLSEMNPPDRREGALGYGYGWYVFDGPRATGAYRGAYTAIGVYGQYLTIIPALDMVVAHMADVFGYPDRAVTGRQYAGILDRLIAAKTQ